MKKDILPPKLIVSHVYKRINAIHRAPKCLFSVTTGHAAPRHMFAFFSEKDLHEEERKYRNFLNEF
jgi:hypothetical protein